MLHSQPPSARTELASPLTIAAIDACFMPRAGRPARAKLIRRRQLIVALGGDPSGR
jgi:hypothetical protein